MVADVETGVANRVWTADEGPGSAIRQVSADNQLFWGADDRLVFPWEKDGWTHMYSVAVNGGEPGATEMPEGVARCPECGARRESQA